MKNRRILIFIILMIVLAVAATALVACDEQNPYRTISFETGGGNAIQPIRAKAGEEIIAPANPTRKGYAFDGWSDEPNGAPVALPTSMPDGDVIYYARWREQALTANYRIEFLLENVEGDDFEVEPSRTQTGEGIVGDTITVTLPGIANMHFLPERSSDLTLVIQEGENVVSLYFARDVFRLTLSEGEGKDGVQEIEAKFGRKIALPNADYTDGDRMFIGWAEKENAENGDILIPGEEVEMTSNKRLYAQFGTAYEEAFSKGGKVALGDVEEGERVALYISADGAREWGVASGCADKDTFETENHKGIFDRYGNFRLDETGLYAAYRLLEDRTDKSFGTLELNSSDMTATYTTAEGVEKSGNYSYLAQNNALTGELQLIAGSERISFRLGLSDETPEGYAGNFTVKGDEAGSYGVMADIASLSEEEIYGVELDGYGTMSFPIKMLGGLSLAHGNYKGADAERGIWQFEFVGFIEGVQSDTIYASGGYRDCLFVLKTAIKRVNGEAVSESKVLVRDVPGTEGKYTAQDGSVLTLDGFGQGELAKDGDGDALFYDARGNIIKAVVAGERRNFALNDNSFKEVDETAGSYAYGEFEMLLGGINAAAGTGSAKLSHNGRLIAEGAYSLDAFNDDYTFMPIWVDFLYPMINGIAVGEFSFRIEGENISVRNDALFGEYALADGGALKFDGYGKVELDGETYEVGIRISNTVMIDGQGYVIDPSAHTAQKASGLTGEYFTAVDEYIGPGKLAFDGNGVALFYNMVNGGLSGQGSYTYDEETGIGRFIPEPNGEMPVEAFDFRLTSAYDQYGLYYDRVYYKYQDIGHYERDFDKFSILLSGFGYMTDNYSDPANNEYELTFFGMGATYSNPSKGLDLKDGEYVIHYTDVEVNRVDGMAQYNITAAGMLNMTVELIFGERSFTIFITGENAREVGGEYGTYYGYSYQSNLVQSELRLTLDGEGSGRYVNTHTGEREDVSGKYTMNGDVYTFVPDNDMLVAGKTELVFRLITVQLSGGQGTMTLFHVSESSMAKELESEDGSKLSIDGFGDVKYTLADGTEKYADCTLAEHYTEVYDRDKDTRVRESRVLAIFDGEAMMFKLDEEAKKFTRIGVEARTYELFDGEGASNEMSVVLDGLGNALLIGVVDVMDMGLFQLPVTDTVAVAKYSVSEEDDNYIDIFDIVIVEKYAELNKFPQQDFTIVLGSIVTSTSMDYIFAWGEGFKKTYSTQDGRQITVNGFDSIRASGFEGVTESFYLSFEERKIGGQTVYVFTAQSGNGRTTYVYYFSLGEDGTTLTELKPEMELV